MHPDIWGCVLPLGSQLRTETQAGTTAKARPSNHPRKRLQKLQPDQSITEYTTARRVKRSSFIEMGPQISSQTQATAIRSS